MCIRFNSSCFNYKMVALVNFVIFINRIYKGLYIVSSSLPSFQAGYLICEFHHSHYDLVQHWKWPSLSRNSLIASVSPSVLLFSHFFFFLSLSLSSICLFVITFESDFDAVHPTEQWPRVSSQVEREGRRNPYY